MEKSFPCLTGLLNAQPKSNQSHTSVQNVNPPHIDPSSSMHSLPSPSKLKGKSKKGHVQYCAGPNCGNNRHDNPDLPFFRFPKDELRCKQWVNNTRRKDGIINT